MNPERRNARDLERWRSKVALGGERDCWQWTSPGNAGGYGKFTLRFVTVYAHRWTYERFVGPIPEGWTVDHRCHNADPTCEGGPTCLHRRCVNPAHLGLEPTKLTNLANSHNAPANRTHCPQDHPYDEVNTYHRPTGGRSCRACNRIRSAEAKARTKARR